MGEKELALKTAFNAYVDALVDYLADVDATGAENNGPKYVLDRFHDVSIFNSTAFMLARANDAYARERLAERKNT